MSMLPRSSHSGSDREQHADPSVTTVEGKRRRPLVLIVDDEAYVRDVVRRILTRYQVDVLEAPGGHQAIAVADGHREPIDMLITDLQMPEMNGDALAEALHARYPTLKVLFLTGFSDDLFKRRELLPGWAAYLDKPIEPEALRETAALLLYGTTNPEGALSKDRDPAPT